MKKRKRKVQKKLLLLDKSVLRLLTPEQRKRLDSKHTILYPPILSIENAQHGLDSDRPSPLFDFRNTVSVLHWGQRAKLDLLKAPSHCHRVGAKIPAASIYEEPEADRKEMERQALRVVEEMEAVEERLKNQMSLLRGIIDIGDAKLIELAMDHRDIPDENIVRAFNQAIGQLSQNIPLSARIPLIARGRRNVSDIREALDNYRDNYKEFFIVDTLEKAYRWVRQTIYYDTESILKFLCNVCIIPLSIDEQTEIFNRFNKAGKPPIDKFAPYARAATQLYSTIFLYLAENRENSSPRGALRDFEYLYYAIDTNVTFISSDLWHKKCIEEIPILERARRNFKFLPHRNKNEREFKKVLNSIGIKA